MSPTDHPAEPGGALHAFFADRLPNTPPVAAAAAAQLRGAHETAPLAAAPHVDVGLAGAAVDHLLRFAIAARPCPPGSSCHRGAGRLGCGAAAMRAVDDGLEHVGLLAPYRRDVSDDEWLELTQISLLLATFERVDRTGLAAASLRNLARIPAGWREWAQLVCVEEDVEDVAVLGWAAAVDHRDLRGQRLTCNPRFAQTSMLGVGGADLLTDRGLLLGFTSTSSRGVCSGKDLWRLCSDVLAAAHDEHAIAGVGISALRWRTRATWQVDELFEQLAGKPVAIDDLRREFAQLLERVAADRLRAREAARTARPRLEEPSPRAGQASRATTLSSMPAPPAGLCDTCRHQRVVRNTRGSSFSLCRRSKEDDRYPRYPRLPVLTCPGHEPHPPQDEPA